MLPTWLIKKINKKEKDNFIQEQLYIEKYPIQEIEKIERKEEIVQRGIIVIDLF